MSRVGKQVIQIPATVELTQSGSDFAVKGPKGQLAWTIPDSIHLSVESGAATVTRDNDEGATRALHGLTRSLINNMVIGVTDGFTKVLEITGVGYRAQLSGRSLTLQVGYSHPVEINPPDGVEFTVESPTRVLVSGIDKQAVGETAAIVRRVRKPEPYKGKGIRYSDEVIRRKAGKAGRAA